jgi:hypothetical protein
MKNPVSWDVTLCSSCKNRRFGRTHQLLLTANVVPSPPIRFTLMMWAILSSETSARTKTTQRNGPEDSILRLQTPETLDFLAFRILVSDQSAETQ